MNRQQRKLTTLLCSFTFGGAIAALPTEQVQCHYTYGGETHALVATPTTAPYTIDNVQIGSYFQFRIVFQREPADLAAIKLYAFADQEGGPVPIHQATYHYPPTSQSQYGFTGLQFVYEPVRDGELQYWCELINAVGKSQ